MVRVAILSLIGILVASLHPRTLAAQSASEAMVAAANSLLDALTPEQRSAAALPFDTPLRRDWHNIPKEDRKGVEFGELSAEQQKLALALLRSALSDVGYEKATRIMSLENNLREGEKNVAGAPLRDPERYFITIFGEPADKGTWGWSFEGHHFSQNFVVHDGKVVGDTPSFWGANPATVKIFIEGGPEVGTRTLAQEEQLESPVLPGAEGWPSPVKHPGCAEGVPLRPVL